MCGHNNPYSNTFGTSVVFSLNTSYTSTWFYTSLVHYSPVAPYPTADEAGSTKSQTYKEKKEKKEN